jgi:hypothetical protein
VKLITHLYIVPRSRMVELYLHSPLCLHGVVFNELGTGTNLLLPGSDVGMDIPALLSGEFKFFLSLSRKMLG